MRYKVYGNKPQDEVELRLIYWEGNVTLVAVNPDGSVVEGGYLLDITEQGIKRRHDVSPKLGFMLDSLGKLQVTDWTVGSKP